VGTVRQKNSAFLAKNLTYTFKVVETLNITTGATYLGESNGPEALGELGNASDKTSFDLPA